MLFNSGIFLQFFAAFLLLYWLVRSSLSRRNWLILAASYLFYGWWTPATVSGLAGTAPNLLLDALWHCRFLALLIANHRLPLDASVPLWVVLAAHSAIGLGTLFGGWRIVHTMGTKITKVQPVGGFSAETAAAAAIMLATLGGVPVSTTHTITGAIIGTGTTQRLSAVRWGIASRVVWAWVLTIPGAFAVSYFVETLLKGMMK